MSLRIGLGQINTCVGDFAGNVEIVRRMYHQALRDKVEVLVFPELAVCGYPPEDLLLKRHFLDDNRWAINNIASNCPDIAVVMGFAEGNSNGCYNALAVLHDGHVEKIYRKRLLPNYGVFDEKRYFKEGGETAVIDIKGFQAALTICEDIWDIEQMRHLFHNVPRVDILLNISASPFYMGKIRQRQEVLSRCANSFRCAAGYCNLVGGQDELIFDGQSLFVDSKGVLAAAAKPFEEDLLIADIDSAGGTVEVKAIKSPTSRTTDTLEEVYLALVVGTRDYVKKNKFEKVVVGLSGGVDSSVTAAIAAAALGPENVMGVTMPSKFNSPETVADAGRQAENLGIRLLTIPIETVLGRFNETLGIVDGWNSRGIAYENLQARIRGSIMMSLSNQFGWLVLTTGNKSETAVGYSTLYGDTAGGFAVLKDVYKTMVYKIANFINRINAREVIPKSVINREPTAELRAGQKDRDALPDYEVLDKILKGYVEDDKSAKQLVEEGLAADEVNRVVRMVDRNEYKRRQSPPGIKITPKAFGRDRRLPITNCYTTQAEP